MDAAAEEAPVGSADGSDAGAGGCADAGGDGRCAVAIARWVAGGAGAQAVSPIATPMARPSPASEALECAPSERANMWVILLEAAGVLTLVLLLVWWTLRGRK
jgi:hypothetical protein